MRSRAGLSILVAVALFASGLALLRHLERGERRDIARSRPEGRVLPALERREDVGQGLTVDGRLQVTHYAEGPEEVRTRSMELAAADTDSAEDGATILHDVRILLNDVETGDVRAVIAAEKGRTFLVDPVLGPPDDDAVRRNYVWLEEIDVTLYEDVPVSPLLLRVPTLEGSLATRTFTSEDPAKATAPGLEATGKGLLLDLTRGVLRFDAAARVTISEGDVPQAVLSSAGKLHVLRGSPARGGAEVVARKDARLVTFGEPPLEVSGQLINAIASEPSDAGEGLRLEQLAADGGAVVESPVGRFEADRADLRLGEDGAWTVTLVEEPRADLHVSLAEDDPDEQPLDVHLEGVGPLRLELREETSFDLGGPALATLEGVELESSGGLRGWASEDRTRFGLETSVRTWLRRAGTELVADGLHAEVGLRSGHEPTIEAVTAGQTVLTGRTPAGESYRVDAEEQLVLVGSGESWSVPVALGVTLQVAGPAPMTVRAERVEDLDVDALSLVAEGAVDVQRGERRARGARFEGRGPESFTLRGSPDEPARLDAPGATVRARRVDREGGLLVATGDVVADLTRDGTVARITSEFFEMEEDARAGDGVERLRLRSRGAVRAEVVQGESTFEGWGETLFADLERTLDPEGNELASQGRVVLSGNVRARARDPLAEREVFANQVHFEHAAPGSPAWSLVAEGDLRFRELGELVLDGSGHRLVTAEGDDVSLTGSDDQLVHVEGLLPGGGHPFALDAPEAQWSAERILARDVTLHVRRFVLLASAPGAGPEGPELVVRAHRALLSEAELALDGRVRLDGVDEQGLPVALETESARLTGAPEAEAGGYGRIVADGGFTLSWGEGLEVVGEDLDARSASGRLRITGDPAEVRYGEWVQASDALEYDLYLRMIVETARSTVRPRRGAPPTPDAR